MDVKGLLRKFSKEMSEWKMSFIFKQLDHPGFYMKIQDETSVRYTTYAEKDDISEPSLNTMQIENLRTFEVTGVELPATRLRRRVRPDDGQKLRPMHEYLIIHVR